MKLLRIACLISFKNSPHGQTSLSMPPPLETNNRCTAAQLHRSIIFHSPLCRLIVMSVSLILMAFFCGCVTTGESGRAQGSSGPNLRATYPESEYLTAEGTGQTEAGAKNRALSELARIFEARVVSETSDSMVSLYTDKGGKKSEVFAQQIRTKVQVTSGMAFEGVRTEDTWFSDKDSQYHALAVLNRIEARSAWLAKIKDLDDRILADLSAISTIQSRFVRLRGYKRMENLWIERTIYTSRVRVIGSTVPAPGYDMGEIIESLAGIHAEITLFLDITGDHADILRDGLSGVLTTGGFRFAASSEEADILISGQVSVNPLDLDNPGWRFLRAEARVALTDLKTGENVASVSKYSRAARVDYREASKEAVRKVTRQVSGELLDLFR